LSITHTQYVAPLDKCLSVKYCHSSFAIQ